MTDNATSHYSQDVILALRPEAVRMGLKAEGAMLHGEIVSHTYLGTTVRYRVIVAGQHFTVDDPDPAGRPLLTGTLTLSFDPSRVRMWPADSVGVDLP